jgi:methyl-accepting chemotaxis protein
MITDRLKKLTIQAKVVLPLAISAILISTLIYVIFSRSILETKKEEHITRMREILVAADEAAKFTATQYGVDLYQQGLKDETRTKHSGPYAVAFDVATTLSGKMGAEFRATAIDPMNAGNRPDEGESAALQKFRMDKLEEYWTYDAKTCEMRYFRPVRLRDECILCHAEQRSSGSGIHTVKTGDLYGAFEIRASLKEKIAEGASKARLVGLMVLLAGLGVVLTGYSIARWLSQPMREFAMQSESVARGDLRYAHTPSLDKKMTSADELGQLTRAFDTMITYLRSIIRKVDEATAAVASASAEISASSDEMAAGAKEQNSQASYVAKAVEDMTATINTNSRSATNATQIAERAREAATQGGKVVTATVEGMERISAVVRKSAKTVTDLGISSDQIGEIINVIDDIADQTNLLALNAAIEAARAGEQGRGFAVVADEVRKLAERTTKATREISQMIQNIQTETRDAVAAMREGTAEVDAGIEQASAAGESLRQIVSISQEVTDTITAIANGSLQQAQASENILRNVESITSVTERTAMMTTQVAATTEDLTRLTTVLQDLVSQFQLDATPLEKEAAQGNSGHTAYRNDRAPIRDHPRLAAKPGIPSRLPHNGSGGNGSARY